MLLLVSCGDGLNEVADDQILEVDFIGALTAVPEAVEWVNEPNPAGSEQNGGPDSAWLVGPGTIAISEDEEIEIGTRTPGLFNCAGLPGDEGRSGNSGRCLIFGQIDGDASGQAAWIAGVPAQLRADGNLQVGLDDIRGAQLIVSYGQGDPALALDLSGDARLVGCDPSGPIGAVDGDLVLPETSPSGGYLLVVEPENYSVIEISCEL